MSTSTTSNNKLNEKEINDLGGIGSDVESTIKQEFRHHVHNNTQAYSRNKLNEEEINEIDDDS